MLDARYTAKFKRDYKTVKSRGYDAKLLKEAIVLLVEEQPLPQKYRDHALKGDYAGHRECHITPDWLLIYRIEQSLLILELTRTGTHSDLF